jgi:AcrR family transcriptional regulator
MLAAAVATVHRSGLTVSLGHISLEDVIRDAGVSRSAVYRRWPYKDLFLSDLLKELARDATPDMADDELRLIRSIFAQRQDWLDTAERRWHLILELFRQLAAFDFETMYVSTEWRTYIALHATFMSLADGELRREVQASLAASERRRSERIAKSWERLTSLFGYRLRPELGLTFAALATLLSAQLRGMILMALADTHLATYRVEAEPFGSAGRDAWTLVGIGLASTATALIEPDPGVEWDAARIAGLGRALESLEPPPGGSAS